MNDALTLLVQPLATAVAEEVARRMVEARSADLPSEVARLQSLTRLDLWRAYTAKEAAVFLGLSEKSVYAIPPEELGRSYTGRAGTSVRFLGINLLMHLLKLPPVDTQKVGRDVRARFLRQAEQLFPPVDRAPELPANVHPMLGAQKEEAEPLPAKRRVL